MAAPPVSAPIVHCRVCSSALLQPLGVAGPVDGLSVVSCYCPDCEWSDVIVAEALAVELWLLRNDRLTGCLEAMADALAVEYALLRVAAQ
jgi:ribosomal protein S27E